MLLFQSVYWLPIANQQLILYSSVVSEQQLFKVCFCPRLLQHHSASAIRFNSGRRFAVVLASADSFIRANIFSLLNFITVSMNICKRQKQPISISSTFSFNKYSCAVGAGADSCNADQLCEDRHLLFSFTQLLNQVICGFPVFAISFFNSIQLQQKHFSSGRRFALVTMSGRQLTLSHH